MGARGHRSLGSSGVPGSNKPVPAACEGAGWPPLPRHRRGGWAVACTAQPQLPAPPLSQPAPPHPPCAKHAWRPGPAQTCPCCWHGQAAEPGSHGRPPRTRRGPGPVGSCQAAPLARQGSHLFRLASPGPNGRGTAYPPVSQFRHSIAPTEKMYKFVTVETWQIRLGRTSCPPQPDSEDKGDPEGEVTVVTRVTMMTRMEWECKM